MEIDLKSYGFKVRTGNERHQSRPLCTKLRDCHVFFFSNPTGQQFSGNLRDQMYSHEKKTVIKSLVLRSSKRESDN